MKSVKRFWVWMVRIVGFSILLPGIVNAFSGHALTLLMRGLASPIVGYAAIMPKDNSWDGAKWGFVTLTLAIELIIITAIVVILLQLRRGSQLSTAAMRSVVHMMRNLESRVKDLWNIAPHEADFYWLVAKGNKYEYFSCDRPLNELDKRVIEQLIRENTTVKYETDLHHSYPRHSAYQLAWKSVKNGKVLTAVLVFVKQNNLLSSVTQQAFESIIDPLLEVDGTNELMVELSKKRGEVVV